MDWYINERLRLHRRKSQLLNKQRSRLRDCRTTYFISCHKFSNQWKKLCRSWFKPRLVRVQIRSPKQWIICINVCVWKWVQRERELNVILIGSSVEALKVYNKTVWLLVNRLNNIERLINRSENVNCKILSNIWLWLSLRCSIWIRLLVSSNN